MTTAELKSLAIDIVENRVFGSWMLPPEDQHLIAAIFLPLALGGGDKLPENAWGVYEYSLNAKKDKIRNNYPTFITCKYLTQADCLVLNPLIESYASIKNNFMDGNNGEQEQG